MDSLPCMDLAAATSGKGSRLTHRLALDGLDLDHPGAQLAQHRPAERRGEEGAQLQQGHVARADPRGPSCAVPDRVRRCAIPGR